MGRLKRWESPRKQGRNIKGKGGSARLKQIRKQQNLLRKKLISREEGVYGSFFLFLYIGRLAVPKYSSTVRHFYI